MTQQQQRKLTKCEMCGSLMSGFTSTGVCGDCWSKDEEMFQKVRAAMKFGQKVFPEELAGKTGVDIKHINRWMQQGRFG